MADKESYTIALNKSMALCSSREYCCEDIRSKLTAWGVDNEDSDRIIELLIKENFINEPRYASAFVRDKFKYNKWGKVKIAAHLKFKKLNSGVISSALDSIDNEQYNRMLRELIDNHRRTVKSKNQYDLKAKLLRYGLSKGFESNLLYDILNEPGE
jgi:regulatory protein